MQLNPLAGQLSYAVYAVGSPAWEFDAVNVEIQYDDASKVWFGIADYSLGTWCLTPASPGVYSIPAPAGKLYSSGGSAYFAVLAYKRTSVRIQTVSVEMNLPNWEVYTFEDGAPAESYDIALVGDRLYTFYQTGGAELRLAWANIAEPADAIHWTREPVFSLGSQISSLDIEEIAGQPALAFYIGNLGAVAYYQGKTLTPADPSDWTMFTLDFTVDSELAVVPDRVAELDGRSSGSIRACFLGYCSANPDKKLEQERQHQTTNAWPLDLSREDAVAQLEQFRQTSIALRADCQRPATPSSIHPEISQP